MYIIGMSQTHVAYYISPSYNTIIVTVLHYNYIDCATCAIILVHVYKCNFKIIPLNEWGCRDGMNHVKTRGNK